jgi:hypothetical protein
LYQYEFIQLVKYFSSMKKFVRRSFNKFDNNNQMYDEF